MPRQTSLAFFRSWRDEIYEHTTVGAIGREPTALSKLDLIATYPPSAGSK